MSIINIYRGFLYGKPDFSFVDPGPDPEQPLYVEPEDSTTGNSAIFIGDSISANYIVGEGNGWQTIFSSNKGLTEVNSAFAGKCLVPNTCHDNLITDFIQAKTDNLRFVFIALGVNDTYMPIAEIPVELYQATLEAWIDNATGVKGWPVERVIIVTPFYTEFTDATSNCGSTAGGDWERRDAFVQAAINAANNKGAFYMNIFKYMQENGGGSLLSDQLHPTIEGHILIANYFSEIFNSI